MHAGYAQVEKMHALRRAHRVLIVDGDKTHFKQGLDAFQVTTVRSVHPDGDCALVCEEQVGAQSVCVEAGWVPVAWCPVQRASVSKEHDIHAVVTYKVGLVELMPIRASA
jgi:hypothetical protein